MNLDDIAKALNLKIFGGCDKMDTVVLSGYIGDLLSDVMANSKEGDLWITRQVHQNIIAVASLKDLAGIVLVQGAEPTEDTLEKARKESVPIMGTDLYGFEIAGRIYNMIKGEEDSAKL